MTKTAFHETVAQKLIEQMKQGTAPWQCPWMPDATMPMNPLTGKRYRGINAIQLMSEKQGDSRWMTYKQAANVGAQVRKGETGTPIQYWIFTESKRKKDENGKVVFDKQGAPVYEEIRLERPRVFFATVFNAQQIDGLPPMEKKVLSWSPVARAEAILKASSAHIRHEESDRAFYRLSSDSIHLPNQHQFANPEQYYATALHELGHWTGHSFRLDRDLSHPFGSEGYAKEELRAEIASMMLGDELGIGHDPAQHAAYVSSWISVLEQDPLEIFRAAADAEKIQQFVLSFELVQELDNPRTLEEGIAMLNEVQTANNKAVEKIWLTVPYEEREVVKQASGTLPDGRKAVSWDRVSKRWFAHAGADLDKLAPWLLEQQTSRQEAALLPQQEFSEHLKSLGAVITDSHPIMDGQTHRIRTEGDKQGEKSGFYVAHLDGHPAGYMKNNRTGVEITWKSKGYVFNEAQKSDLLAVAAQKREACTFARRESQEQASYRVKEQLAELIPMSIASPYLDRKGIAPRDGIFTDKEAMTTYIPAIDETGKCWTMQTIYEDGTKRFAKEGRKEGGFHAIGGLQAIASSPVIVIAEGYATAASLADVMGIPTIAAFDAGNLELVAGALHKQFPDKPIIVAGDDDKHLELTQGVNVGRDKATKAALAVNGTVVFPVFAPNEQTSDPKLFKDFNDLATKSVLGKEGVNRQLHRAIEQVRSSSVTIQAANHEIMPRSRAVSR